MTMMGAIDTTLIEVKIWIVWFWTDEFEKKLRPGYVLVQAESLS